MERIGDLSGLISTLTVLFVDDDVEIQRFLAMRLRRQFGTVLTAGDGEEALSIFRSEKVDVIICDYIMPGLNGLELVRAIRNISEQVPVIMLTGYMDISFLVESINIGVTQFVAKPVSISALAKAIDSAVQRLVLENLKNKTREQELELLRYRQKYHSLQEEAAFKKELNIIRNDLFHRKLEYVGKDGVHREWLVDVVYEPLDTMSGDSYSLRRIDEGRVLFFLADAMGKGLSASVTSVLTASFVNHTVDLLKEHEAFSLEALLNEYLPYIRKNILDEEIVSAVFLDIDFINETVRYASFSAPRILVETSEGCISLKSNNLPVMQVPIEAHVDEVQCTGMRKMMVSSDGLNESAMTEGVYNESMEQDFRSSRLSHQFHRMIREQVPAFEDDVTVLYLTQMETETLWRHREVVHGTRSAIAHFEESIRDILEEHVAGDVDRESLLFVLHELVMNSYEHGCLGLGQKEKERLVRSGRYQAELEAREKAGTGNIIIECGVLRGESPLFYWRLSDCGCGISPEVFKQALQKSQRHRTPGIVSVLGLGDAVYYSVRGGDVLFLKEIIPSDG